MSPGAGGIVAMLATMAFAAPRTALWRLFVGLEIFPVNLVEVRA